MDIPVQGCRRAAQANPGGLNVESRWREASLIKSPIPRCREKLLSIAHADRTQTDTGGRVENTKAHG